MKTQVNVMISPKLNSDSMNLAKPRNAVWKQIIANFIISLSLATAPICPTLGAAPLLQVHAVPSPES